jgi:VWFA-related protein
VVAAQEPVERLELYVNGVRRNVVTARELRATLDIGLYLRRLRLRAVGYDGGGRLLGEDVMTVNDPRPPFRLELAAPVDWPASGEVLLQANLLRPPELRIIGVDFYVGEQWVSTDGVEPYLATIEAERFPAAVYARAVARAEGEEANAVAFFGGELEHASAQVTVQEIPLSVVGGGAPLSPEALTLRDGGTQRVVERLVPAGEQPLHVILLIDYSESMLEELPVVKAAARELARAVLRPQDRLAVVGFNQRTFWLTDYTNDWSRVAEAVDRVRPIGQTHLYDSVVAMLYELQRKPGRHALVVLTDGADQGSRFELDHLVHYARYAGVPVYPVIKNRSLQRWMKLGVGKLHARRLARMAEDTGATYFIVEREDQLAGVYRRIAQELRQQYQLVFHSETDGADRWRPLEVVSRAGHRLRAPRGYFP